MQPSGSLPEGFITVEQAVKLINSDTRAKATVDMRYLVNNIPYIETKHNFTIFMAKHNNGRVERAGVTRCYIADDYEKYLLIRTIKEHYKAMSGKSLNVEEIGIKRNTTTIDTEKNAQGRPMVNLDSTTEVGTAITNDTRVSED